MITRLLVYIFFMICTVKNSYCATFEIIRDAETETFLKEFSKRILEHSDPKLGLVNKTDFLIINNNSVNAFVTGLDRLVFVNSGLITASQNSDAIFGVIAHETGHLHHYHIVKFQNILNEQNRLLSTLIALGIGVFNPAIGFSALTTTIINANNNIIRYSQQNEEEADRFALEVMEKTNMRLEGHAKLMSYFNDLLSEHGVNEKNEKFIEYIMTHPLPRNRLAKLQRFSKENMLTIQPRNLALEDSFNRVRYKLSGYLKESTKLDEMLDLRLENKRAFYELIYDANHLFASRQYPEALKQTNLLIQQEPRNPYFYELRGQIYKFIDIKLATQDIETAIKLRPKECLFQLTYADLIIFKKDTSRFECLKKNIEICQINDRLTDYNSILLKIAQLQKNDIETLYYQAISLFGQKKKKSAIKKLEHAKNLAKTQNNENMLFKIEDLMLLLNK